MATTFKITDKQLSSPPPKDKTYSKHLGGGIYLYVHPNGRKVCRYHYQMDGKKRKFELGEYVMGKGRAAELTAEYNRVHHLRTILGIDPAAEKEMRRAELEEKTAKRERKKAKKMAKKMAMERRDTVADLAEDFLAKYTGTKASGDIAPSTRRTYTWMIGKYVVPNFGQYALEELPDDEILDFIEEMAKTRPTGANQLHAVMSAMFRWATHQRRYNNPRTGARKFRRNPLAGVDRPAPKQKRDRVLDFRVRHGKFKDKGEIKQFWAWLETINPNHADALRLILLAGVRPSEALSLQWEDVFEGELVIPAEKMKSQHSMHTIPFTPQLKVLVDGIREKAKKTDDKAYLFPKRPRSGGGKDEGARSYPHVGHATLSDHILKALRTGKLDMPKFTSHDLRRTMATHVSNLGFDRECVDALLHHKQTGVIEHYDYSEYPAEKKLAALTAWHNRLDELIEGKRIDNVVGIRAGQ